MILRTKARDQFYSWYVNSKHDWSCLYNFSPITFAQICSLADHSLPNVRDAVEAASEGAREGFTRHQNQGKTKTILTRRNAPTIATRRSRGIVTRGRLSGKGEEDCDKDRKSDIDGQRYEEKKIMRGWRDEDKCINNSNKENQSNQ